MNDDYTDRISKLNKIAHETILLFRTFPVICVSALACLDKGDIKGFSDKLDERQDILDRISGLNDEYHVIADSLDGGYGTILEELQKPGAEHMVCPDWCKPLQIKYAETRRLAKTCKILDERLNAHARAFQDNIMSNLDNVKNRKKIRQGYYAVGGSSKGTLINCKSD